MAYLDKVWFLLAQKVISYVTQLQLRQLGQNLTTTDNEVSR